MKQAAQETTNGGKIRRQISGDKARKAARLIKWAEGKECSKAITKVEEVSCELNKDFICGGDGCDKVKHSTKSSVNQAIMRVISKRFPRSPPNW